LGPGEESRESCYPVERLFSCHSIRNRICELLYLGFRQDDRIHGIHKSCRSLAGHPVDQPSCSSIFRRKPQHPPSLERPHPFLPSSGRRGSWKGRASDCSRRPRMLPDFVRLTGKGRPFGFTGFSSCFIRFILLSCRERNSQHKTTKVCGCQPVSRSVSPSKSPCSARSGGVASAGSRPPAVCMSSGSLATTWRGERTISPVLRRITRL